MIDATLCFLVQGNPPERVLLGLKKAGFGAGKYGGFGGKVEANETVTMAAVRELEEEVGIKILERDLQRMGHLTFLFPANPAWSQVVHVFLVTTWDGNPAESPEMKPAWFTVDDIPFDRMWQDGPHWLPHILGGKRIRARFTFKEDNETIAEMEIETWDGDSQERYEPYPTSSNADATPPTTSEPKIGSA
jgi:8-oxo-dGTP pyrophosphatase MutT (NUDIX family)